MSGSALDRPVLAIDIGGTKMAAGVVDASGLVHSAVRRPTPRSTSPDDAENLFFALVGAVEAALAQANCGIEDLVGIGIGCGGPMQWPDGLVSPLNIAGWRDFPLRDRVAWSWGQRIPVRIHNDAICMVIAEHSVGAAVGADHALCMVVSTGVGGGLVLGGRLIDGATGNTGHIGHVVIEADGPPCSCGGRGCLEPIARGPALAAWALERGWRAQEVVAPAANPRSHDDVDPESSARELARSAAAGDPIAVAAFERGGRAVGAGIASAAALLDLDVVVIGGGVAAAGPVFWDAVAAGFDEYAGFPFARKTRIVPAIAAEPGLVGAAALITHGTTYWNAP